MRPRLLPYNTTTTPQVTTTFVISQTHDGPHTHEDVMLACIAAPSQLKARSPLSVSLPLI